MKNQQKGRKRAAKVARKLRREEKSARYWVRKLAAWEREARAMAQLGKPVIRPALPVIGGD